MARLCSVDARWLVDGTNAPPYMQAGVTEASVMAERAQIADRLHELFDRVRDVVSIGQVAVQLGLTPPQLAHIAGNRSSPRRHLQGLAMALGIPESWLRSGQPVLSWEQIRRMVAQRFPAS